MEIAAFVDQRRTKVEHFIAKHQVPLSRQGAVVATYRQRGERRLGPYYRLTCRVGRRQLAVYLGNDEQLLAEVREHLAEMQHARRLSTQLTVLRRALRREARVARQTLASELVHLGLHRQGNEVRGWRAAQQHWDAATLVASSPMIGTASSAVTD